MKTLILNGSPRKNGNTMSLIRRLTDKLNGDILVVDAYKGDISPCIDCRYCKDHPGCAIDDGMQKVYRYIESCDSIVIASPIYFNELTGRLLDVVSRAQMYFCASHFRNEKLIVNSKKGAIILTGGGMNKYKTAEETATLILHTLGCNEIFDTVCSLATDIIAAKDDAKALADTDRLADYLNR